MPHHNLYTSLGLNPYGDSDELSQQLSMRIAATPQFDASMLEELQIAQAILGHPARRRLYDTQLYNPNAPTITADALRQLASMDFGGHTGSQETWATPTHGHRSFNGPHSTFETPNPPHAHSPRNHTKGFVASAHNKSKNLRTSTIRNPKLAWIVGGSAALLIVAMIAVAGLVALGDPSPADDGSESPAFDTFAGQNWIDDNFAPIEQQQFLDAELATSALHSADADGNFKEQLAYRLPNGLFREHPASAQQVPIQVAPGMPPYMVKFTSQAENVKESWAAFSEAEGKPVIIWASYTETPVQGLSEKQSFLMVEIFDAVNGSDIDRKELEWPPQDGDPEDMPAPMTYSNHIISIRSGGQIFTLDVESGSLQTILSTNIIREHYPNSDTSVSPSGAIFHNQGVPYYALIFNEKTGNRLTRVVALVSLRDGTFNIAHEFTHSPQHYPGYYEPSMMPSWTMHESPAGIAIFNPHDHNVLVWNEDSGTTETDASLEQYFEAENFSSGKQLISWEESVGVRVISLEDGTERLSWLPSKLEDLSITDVSADDDFLYLKQSGSWFKVDLDTGEEIDEPVLSVPRSNSGGYERRASPTASEGWNGKKTAVFSFHR